MRFCDTIVVLKGNSNLKDEFIEFIRFEQVSD